jgi:hypothetical protein
MKAILTKTVIFIILGFITTAWAKDTVIEVQVSDSIKLDILQPEGWEIIQAEQPTVLIQDPQLSFVGAVHTTDNLIKGEIRHLNLGGADAHLFFKDFADQVLQVKLERDFTIGSKQDKSIFRMAYVDQNRSQYLEQVCVDKDSAASVLLKVPADNPNLPVALNVLNHFRCSFSEK